MGKTRKKMKIFRKENEIDGNESLRNSRKYFSHQVSFFLVPWDPRTSSSGSFLFSLGYRGPGSLVQAIPYSHFLRRRNLRLVFKLMVRARTPIGSLAVSRNLIDQESEPTIISFRSHSIFSQIYQPLRLPAGGYRYAPIALLKAK